MNFEFKPSDDNRSLREFIKYIVTTSPGHKIYLDTFKIVSIIFVLFTIIPIFSEMYETFSMILIGGIIEVVVIILLIEGIRLLLSKINHNKVSNFFLDNDSRFIFTINEEYLIRESEYSTFKIPLREVEKIDKLKESIVLLTKREGISIFIPVKYIPIPLDEFYNIFIKANKNLEKRDFYKDLKTFKKKYSLIIVSSSILAVVISFFVGKYNYENNFTKYNLVMQETLEKVNYNDSYLYNNEELGIKIFFPNKWNGKYGIEEESNRVNIYYLANGVQSRNTELLFTVSKANNVEGLEELTNIKTINNQNGKYLVYVPSKLKVLKDNTEEFEEFKKMHTGVYKLDIK